MYCKITLRLWCVLLIYTFVEANWNRSLVDILHEYSEIPTKCIWRKKHEISESHPFIFFHQRKTGGSSIRTTLHNASRYLNLSHFITEMDNISNTLYKIHLKEQYAVYGGHFSWSSNIDQLQDRSDEVSEKLINPYCYRNDFSCLTNFRDPLARIESCIYERYGHIFQRYNISCINDLPVNEFALLNINFRRSNRAPFSCLNEPFRMFYTDDETNLNSLGFVYNNDTKTVTPRQSRSDLFALSVTITRLTQCVPIILDMIESRNLLNKTFPTLYATNAFKSIHVRTANNGIDCAKPNGVHLEILQNLTHFEKILYDAVVNKVRIVVGMSDGLR